MVVVYVMGMKTVLIIMKKKSLKRFIRWRVDFFSISS